MALYIESLTFKMDNTRCNHDWEEKNNKIVCSKCNKSKLNLSKVDNQDIKYGVRNNGKKYSVRTHRGKIFYPEEWMKLMNNVETKKQERTFKILINTGARINEARHIKVGDVDFLNNRLLIRVMKKRKDQSPIPKEIRISKKFKNYLKSIKKDLKLENDETFNILSTASANIALKKLCKKSKIKEYYMYSIHNIRKTFGCWLIFTGVETQQVLLHLRHNSMTALKHYHRADTYTYKEKMQIVSILGIVFETMRKFK